MVEYSLYLKKKSILHSMDPRSKILMVLTVIILVLLFYNPYIIITIFITQTILSRILGKIKFKNIIEVLKPVTPLIIITFILWPIFSTQGKILLSYKFITIRTTGFLIGASMAFRIANMVLVSSILMMTTLQKDLILGFKKIGLPYDYGLTITIALRYIPTLTKSAQIIMDAQRSRGLELDKGNIIKRAKKHIPILVPLVVISMKMAHDLSIALESRGFGSKNKRTIMKKLKMKKKDYISSTILITIIIISTYLRIKGYGTLQL